MRFPGVCSLVREEEGQENKQRNETAVHCDKCHKGKKQSEVTSEAQVKGTSEEVTFELRSEWQEGVGLCKPAGWALLQATWRAETSRGNRMQADSEAAVARHRMGSFTCLVSSSLWIMLHLTAWSSSFWLKTLRKLKGRTEQIIFLFLNGVYPTFWIVLLFNFFDMLV